MTYKRTVYLVALNVSKYKKILSNTKSVDPVRVEIIWNQKVEKLTIKQ